MSRFTDIELNNNHPADNKDSHLKILPVNTYKPFIWLLLLLPCVLKSQVPTLISMNPDEGAVGSSVTLTGTNFDPIPANNVVHFGGVEATVNSATTTQLVVTVPQGPSNAQVSITVNDLIAQAPTPFVVTPQGNEAINAHTFIDPQNEDLSSGATISALGDLDGDGWIDLAAIPNDNSAIILYRNASTGPGAISLSSTLFLAHEGSNDIKLADFDGDGKLDIAVCNDGDNTNQAKLTIFRNVSTGSGDMSFASAVDYDLGFSVNLISLASSDLDGDGRLDIAVVNETNDKVHVFRNTSSGPGVTDFTHTLNLVTGNTPYSVSISDMDGDKLPDIVVADRMPNVSIFRNTRTPGNLSFATKMDFALSGTLLTHVNVGDMDGDGLADVVASHVSAQLSVFRNTSTVGNLSMAARIDYGSASNRTTLADLTGDGKLEMISFNLSSVLVYKNNSSVGTISYDPPQAYDVTGGFSLVIRSAEVADLDRDGEPDLITPFIGFGFSAVGIFKNARSENDLLSYSFPEQTGAATIDDANHTIDIEVVNGTNVTNLVASFGASATVSDVKVGPTLQISGTTANDFSNPVIYTVKAEDGLTQDWTVTVSVAGSCAPDQVVRNESSCGSYDFDGTTLTTSGTYNGTFLNQSGCDSLVTLNLTILETSRKELDVVTSSTYDFAGTILTKSGTYSTTLTNQVGCDSLVTLNLTIADPGEIAFHEVVTSITPVRISSSAFGDVDNDGDQDLMVVGSDASSSYIAELYINDGGGGYDLKTGQPFVGISGSPGSVRFGDVDDDDDLDIFMAGGTASTKETAVYINDGDGNYSLSTASSFRTVNATSSIFGDFDQDGVIDLFYTGNDGSGDFAELYRNDGSGAFSLQTALTGGMSSTSDAEDLNGDGYLDLILNFTDASATDLTEVYLGRGDGTFSVLSQSLFDAYHGVARLVDINGDNHTDIFITGAESYSASSMKTSIFLNDGTGSFSEFTSHGLPAVILGDVNFSDLDLDGDADVIMMGYDHSFSPVTYLFENDGSGMFSEVSSITLPDLYQGNISTADVNGDGFPDLFLTGNSAGQRTSQLHINSNCEDEIEIDIRECDSFEFNGNTLTKSGVYEATFSNQYGCDSLVTLNLSILSEIQHVTVYTMDSSYNFGGTSIANTGYYHETFINQSGCDSLVNLSLTFEPAPGTMNAQPRFVVNGSGIPPYQADFDPFTEGKMRIGDLDGDGDLDIVTGGIVDRSAGLPVYAETKVYLNDGFSNFSEKQDAGLVGRYSGDMELFDVDADGDLDVLQIGWFPNSVFMTSLDLNDGTGKFRSGSISELPKAAYSNLGIGDLDNDGDLDVVVTGVDESFSNFSRIYWNDGFGAFTADTQSSLKPIKEGDIAIGDLNGDNNPDIVISGTDGSNHTLVYMNDGSGVFTEQSGNGLEGFNRSITLLDVDQNNTLDIVIRKKIYLNNGFGIFVEDTDDPLGEFIVPKIRLIDDLNQDNVEDMVLIKGSKTQVLLGDGRGKYTLSEELPPVKNGAAALGVLNGDNYPEIVATGEIGSADKIDSELYVNDGTGKYIRNELNAIAELSDGDAAFADLDGDGDLDLITCGNAIEPHSIYTDNEESTQLYFNDGAGNFLEDTSHPFYQVSGEVLLSDFDGDGDVDALISGHEYDRLSSDPPYSGVTGLYLNDGTGKFTLKEDAGIQDNTSFGTMGTADLDNDGDMDLVLGARIMLNDGDGVFTVSVNHDMVGLSHATTSLGDVNGDGFVDLFRAGNQSQGSSYLHINDGTGGLFRDVNNSFKGMLAGSSNLVDMDGDGDLDLFVAGWKYTGNFIYENSSVYFNDGLGNFTEDRFNEIINVAEGNSQFSDLDGDGDQDLIISGLPDKNLISRTKVYLNNGLGNFREYEFANLANMRRASLEVADVDGDGRPDIFMSGYRSHTESRLYLNRPCADASRHWVINACDSYTFFGKELTSSGLYTHVSENGCGGTNTVNLELTILKTSSETNVQACKSYEWEGSTYTSTGTYRKVLTSSAGCDSTAVLNLTILEPMKGAADIKVCGSYQWQGATYTTSGTYQKLLRSSAGCDSTAVLNLTIVQATTGEETIKVCESYKWQGTTYNTSGIYKKALTNSKGCDSTAVLNLTILAPTTGEKTINACESYKWQGTTYDSSGTYKKVLTNSKGCDSTAVLNLTILRQTAGEKNVRVCKSYEWQGATYMATGIYQKMLTNSVGCDSTATLNLTVLQPVEVSKSIEACGTYDFNGQTLTTSGQYTGIFTNHQGCDSLVSLDLTLLEKFETTSFIDACGSFVFGSHLITTSGVYEQSFTSLKGCDSLVSLTVGILPEPEVDIVEKGGVLHVSNPNTDWSYQWINCVSGEEIPNETTTDFTPGDDGEYAVRVSNSVCSISSDCLLFKKTATVLSNSTQDVFDIEVYPNPSNGPVVIDLGAPKTFDMVVISMDGKIIQERHVERKEKIEFEIDFPGLYLIRLEIEGENQPHFIKLNRR